MSQNKGKGWSWLLQDSYLPETEGEQTSLPVTLSADQASRVTCKVSSAGLKSFLAPFNGKLPCQQVSSCSLQARENTGRSNLERLFPRFASKGFLTPSNLSYIPQISLPLCGQPKHSHHHPPPPL